MQPWHARRQVLACKCSGVARSLLGRQQAHAGNHTASSSKRLQSLLLPAGGAVILNATEPADLKGLISERAAP